MSTSWGCYEYFGGCSIHRGFQHKSKAFINLLPHMNHDIPRCTEHLPMCSRYPPCTGMVAPRCTEHPLPNVLKIPRSTEHTLYRVKTGNSPLLVAPGQRKTHVGNNSHQSVNRPWMKQILLTRYAQTEKLIYVWSKGVIQVSPGRLMEMSVYSVRTSQFDHSSVVGESENDY